MGPGRLYQYQYTTPGRIWPIAKRTQLEQLTSSHTQSIVLALPLSIISPPVVRVESGPIDIVILVCAVRRAN